MAKRKKKPEWTEDDDELEFGGLTNSERADFTIPALEAFAAETGQRMEDDQLEIVSDLMADLMHYCRREGLDFDLALRSAEGNYNAECRFEE